MNLQYIFLVVFLTNFVQSDVKISPYFAGGNETVIEDYPYTASIQYSFYGHVCAGAILSEEWIITVARCVVEFERELLSVVVNTTSLDIINNKYNVIEVIIHPQFNNYPLPDNDIALLKVDKINFGSDINSIKLPENNLVEIFQTCIVTGWGAKEPGGYIPWDLQSLNQKLFPFGLCERAFSALTNSSLTSLPESTLCASNGNVTALGFGPCVGEWGSPLSCKINNQDILVGLVSGDPLFCGRLPAPNLYTRVSYFTDWINNIIN